MSVTRQLMAPIDIHSIFFFLTMDDEGAVNCLVTDILKYLLLCIFNFGVKNEISIFSNMSDLGFICVW